LDVQRSIRLTDAALQQLGDFPELTDLVLVENLFTNQGLAHVARVERLQSLDLRGCSQIDASVTARNWSSARGAAGGIAASGAHPAASETPRTRKARRRT
jgi:hypothetical protein